MVSIVVPRLMHIHSSINVIPQLVDLVEGAEKILLDAILLGVSFWKFFSQL